MTKRPDLARLDDDVARHVRRVERTPVGVLLTGVAGIAGMVGLDRLYNQQLSLVGWLAVLGLATLTLPVAAALRIFAKGHEMWALREQAARRALEEPPSHPPDRPVTRPRTARQNRPSEVRSRARLTPVPQDPPEAKSR